MLIDSQKMTNNIYFEKWTADEVAEWLRGLMDDAMIPYMHFFLNNGVDGRKLMLMSHADLEKLNVTKLGHQELILEAIDLLRTLRYGYETENLQSLALHLGCKARSLNGEIRACTGENDRNKANTSHLGDSRPKRLSIGILSTVADLVSTLKSLVAWMDKAPFCGYHDLCLTRNTIVKMGLDLINYCQKESYIPDVEQCISDTTNTLSDICEKLVIGSPESQLDPLYVQPASLELATIRKKQGEELGMHILSSYYGVHVISGIKDMSPADLCGKIEKGDEVIQVNNQTVVGWQLKILVNHLKEKPKEVVLLLKKRPRHMIPYGVMPNKKKINMMSNKHPVQSSTLPKSLKKLRSRDGEPKQLRPSLHEYVNSVPSTGDELYSPKEPVTDGNDTDNDVFRSGSESPQFTLPVSPDPKQRRATVSGGSPTLSRPLLVIEDIDTPSRPKSFTITGTNMPHEIIINSPSGENLADIHKFVSAMEKRKDYKAKSTPPSLEFNVRKPTPKIVEPVSKLDVKEVQYGLQKLTTTDMKITVRSPDSDHDSPQKENKDLPSAPEADDTSTDTSIQSPERISQSPERLLDSSTDSVPPSESSIESSQTCTSSLESSSQSPPLESSASSEKECSDFASVDSSVPRYHPHTFVAPLSQRTPPTRRAQRTEIPSDCDKNQPQLMKIRKIDSVHIHTREPEVSKTERHVAFSGVDSDKEAEDSNSYVCKIVGGVVQKIPVSSKGSPSESPVVKRRPKTGRSKRVDRRVSCKDLGRGDCEGWLFKRRSKGGGPLHSNWQKRYCVIKDYNLFCYHDKQALKAEVVIHLPAFQVSPVGLAELKTKKHAFKIHNSGTSFLFASDRQEDMSKWMNKMGLAAITFSENVGSKRPKHRTPAEDPDFSESETEEEPDPTFHGSTHDISHSSHDLHIPPVDMRASQEDLPTMMRRQSQKAQNIYGEDKNVSRKSVLTKEQELNVSPEIVKLKKIHSLERALKYKEQELCDIEKALTSPGGGRERLDVIKTLLNTSSGQETDSD